MEWNGWSEGNPPEHHELLPFTRLLGGPMDYTPGTFDILYEKTRNSPRRKKWNDLDKGNSRVNTTLAKQIANWVVIYSPLQMASDMIENYEGHPEDKPIVQIPLRTLIKGILGRVPGTIFIPRVLVGVDVVDDGRQLALGDCAGRGPHALNNDLPDARDRLFRFVSQRGNAQQRQAEQYPGDALILHAPISSCFAMNTQRRTEAMQSVLRMAAASSNFTAREPLFSE